MKLILTRSEVEAIVLQHIRSTMSQSFNQCETSYGYGHDFCTVSVEEPQEPQQAESATLTRVA